jgi:hypothetical protein
VANNFKSDDSFLRKLAVGAAGTNATILRLQELGFNPIELERGSTGFKIWKKIKIKRVRVPDVLCLNTGLRFESRGKTKLEISMSHSLNDPRRCWDFGMRDDDYVSVVLFEQAVDDPVDLQQVSPTHFISVREMRVVYAADQVTITQPKGVEEGSEIRVVWTCATANQQSVISIVEPERMKLTPLNGSRSQWIRLKRNGGEITLSPQVHLGETVAANQIVASVVPVMTELPRATMVSEAYFTGRLSSVNLSERYAAAKALRYRGYVSALNDLETRMNDQEEDIYVQLEAAAALAAFNHKSGWEFIESKLRSSVLTVPLETQLETVIVASEIPNNRSEQLLIEVLQDTQRDDELRAGAAWGLGQFATNISANALVDTFNSSPLEIKVEAARALLRIAEPQIGHLIELLMNGDPSKRDGIAWVLARTGQFNPSDAMIGTDNNLRKWLSYIVGYGRGNFIQSDVEAICQTDPEIYFAASVLWQIVESWINNLKEY